MEDIKLEKINVLYVDDEVGNLTAFKAAFRRDFNIFIVESAEEGIKVLDQNEIEIILTDQRMPETTGIEFLQSIMEKYPEAMQIDGVIGHLSEVVGSADKEPN